MHEIGIGIMKFALALIASCMARAVAAAALAPAALPPPPAAPASAATVTAAPTGATGRGSSTDAEVRHTVIEDDHTRIEELRVRGVPQRIVVTSKGQRAPSYEIITGDGSRDLSDGANTSRGAAGKRVWRVLNF